MYFDNVIDRMPYIEENDRNVFSILKEKKVSFFNVDHPDIGARVQMLIQSWFSDFSESTPLEETDNHESKQ
jgi:hypothetical protein